MTALVVLCQRRVPATLIANVLSVLPAIGMAPVRCNTFWPNGSGISSGATSTECPGGPPATQVGPADQTSCSAAYTPSCGGFANWRCPRCLCLSPVLVLALASMARTHKPYRHRPLPKHPGKAVAWTMKGLTSADRNVRQFIEGELQAMATRHRVTYESGAPRAVLHEVWHAHACLATRASRCG